MHLLNFHWSENRTLEGDIPCSYCAAILISTSQVAGSRHVSPQPMPAYCSQLPTTIYLENKNRRSNKLQPTHNCNFKYFLSHWIRVALISPDGTGQNILTCGFLHTPQVQELYLTSTRKPHFLLQLHQRMVGFSLLQPLSCYRIS